MMSSEKADRMRMELDSVEARLEEEKKRSSDLLLQVKSSAHFPKCGAKPSVGNRFCFTFRDCFYDVVIM